MKNTRFSWLFISDVTAFIIGFFGFIFLAFPKEQFLQQSNIHAPTFSLLIILWILVLYIFNFYDFQKSKPNIVFLRNFGLAGIIMLVIGIIFFYLNPITAIAPKSNLVIFIGISLFIILGFRRLIYSVTRNNIHTKCAIICNHPLGKKLADEFHNHPELGFACIGMYPDIQSFITSSPETQLIIVDTHHRSEISEMEQLLKTNSEIIDIIEAYETILYKIPVDLVTPDWIIHSIKKSFSPFYSTVSRTIEILVALLIIVITLPVTLVTALAIKITDSGPIFYSQKRTGLLGKTFSLFKFRSMIVDSEKNGAVWASTNDNRITKVGKIIRKLHIDEIPQMWNIIRGDIGLVGPRAERPEFVTTLEKDIPFYYLRHTVKPGFTGWAQIKFRYARTIADSQEKFEYDLYYIKNRNIFMDLGIIIKTVQIIFTHE